MKRSADKMASSVVDTKPPLREHEWNFDGVPKEQLEACYLYEHAREFFKSSKHLQRFLKEWNDPKRKRNGKHLAALRKAWDLLQTRCENFSYVDFDFFPKTSWQDLPVLPKTADVGFEINLRQDAAKHVNEWATRHRKSRFDRLSIATLRELEAPNVHSLEAFQWLHELLRKKPLAHTEYGYFAIDWSYHDSEIKVAFARWLEDQRDERHTLGLSEPHFKSNRGGFRDKLRWLGALRVIEFYKKRCRRKEWVSYPDQMLEMHVKAPYSYYPDLNKAANKAKQEIARLFPNDWSEKDFWRRQAEADRRRKEHPVVPPGAILRGDSEGVSSKS